ncbi:MAG: hypothetical protein ACOH12_09155 [Parvibaculaceae bacterium]
MRKPLIYSGAIHVALIIVTIFGLPAHKFEPVEARVLPVELLTVADVTNLKRLAKKLPKAPKPIEQPTPPKPVPTPEKPKVAPAPEPKAEEPAPPAPEEKAEPIPDKKAEAPKPEEKKPEPPKPENKKPTPVKEKPKKKAFNPNNIAALLNKMPDASSEQAEAQESDKDINVEDQDDPTKPMTVSEIDALKQKINQCFDAGFLAGSQDADKLYAVIKFELAEDGSLIGIPSIDETGPGASGQLAVLARKAVVQCAPYDKLPKDNYGAWKDVEAKFSVAGML